MALSTESRFFGLDLNQLKADIFKTWRKAPQWPPLSWLRPLQLLTLVPAQGEPSAVWENGAPAAGVKSRSAFWAIELPEAMVLRKVLQLPPLDPADCQSAPELEVQAISPFPAEDLLWGYTELSRSKTLVRLQLVLASRNQVQPFIQNRIEQRQQAAGASAGSLTPPEVWVLGPERKPIVFQGFGENLRLQTGRKKWLWNLAGVGLAVALLAAIAITPTAQLRLRALQAVAAYESMASKTTDVVAKREQLIQSADKVAYLAGALADRMDSVKVLSMLTQQLPDDTALQSARIQGSKVTITGLTDNASRLMQLLSNQEGVKDVKAPSAATRIQGVNKESFTIELVLDAKVFGPTLKAQPDPEPEANASSAPAALSATPAEAASPSLVSPVPAAPAASGAASSGIAPAPTSGAAPAKPPRVSRSSVGGTAPSRPATPPAQGGN